MKKFSLLFLILVFISLVLVGCGGGGGHRGTGGDPGGSSQDLPPGIYVFGCYKDLDGSTKACYWVNGTCYALPTPSDHHYSIAVKAVVYGTDLYICGLSGPSADQFTACYWKNATSPIPLQTPVNQVSNASDICFGSTGIYLAGSYGDTFDSPTSNACYWKADGSRVDLGTPGDAFSIAVSGNDVYIGGGLNERAVIWKNTASSPTTIKDSGINGDEAVNGLVVDPAGILYACGGNDGVWFHRFGDPLYTDLGGSNQQALRISIIGSSCYIAGNDDSSNIACYWIVSNGIPTKIPLTLESGFSSAMAWTVFSKDSKIYVVGNEYKVDDSSTPCLWVGGAPSHLQLPNGVTDASTYSGLVK